MKKYITELINTFWLVLKGCGSAVVAAAFTSDANRIGSSVEFSLAGDLLVEWTYRDLFDEDKTTSRRREVLDGIRVVSRYFLVI